MSSVENLKERARSFEQNEQWGEALDLYSQAIDLLSSEDAPDIALFNRSGDLATRIGSAAQAVAFYERAVDFYMDAGLPNNAVAVCKKVMRNLPDRYSIHLKMGQIRVAQGFITDARSSFVTYAESVQAAGDLDEAFRALIEFINLAPDDYEICMILGAQLEQSDRADEALVQYIGAYRIMRRQGLGDLAHNVAARIRKMDPSLDLEQAASDESFNQARSGGSAEDSTSEVAGGEVETEIIGPVDLPLMSFDDDDDDDDPALAVASTEVAEEAAAAKAAGEAAAKAAEEVAAQAAEEAAAKAAEEAAAKAAEEAAARAAEDAAAKAAGEAVTKAAEEAAAAAAEEAAAAKAAEEAAAKAAEEAAAKAAQAAADALKEAADKAAEEAAAEAAEEAAAKAAQAAAAAEQEAAAKAAEEAAAKAVQEAAAKVAAEAAERIAQEIAEEAAAKAAQEAAAKAVEGAAAKATQEAAEEAAAAKAAEEAAAPKAAQEAGATEGAAEAADEGDAKAAAPAVEEPPSSSNVDSKTETPATSSSDAYVDIGAMLLGDEAHTVEKSTRFVVPYEEPTGDDQADFEKMLEQFKKKVSENIETSDVDAHYDLGTAYLEMGLLDEAIGEFQMVLRGSSDHLATYEMLGQTFLQKQEPEAALQALTRGLDTPSEIEEERVGIYYYLGLAHETLGNTDTAMDYYDKVFAIDINFADVTDRLRGLRS